MILRLAASAAVAALVALPARADAPSRLGHDVVPTTEEVRLRADADSPSYQGEVTITVEVRQPVDTVRLHARAIAIDSASWDEGHGPRVASHDATPEGLLTLRMDAALTAGTHRLAVTFHAPFGTQAVGFYRVSKDGLGYAFTQFEAADARAAFPCWDEPEFKIPFSVTLTIPERHTALANTPIAEESVADGWRTVRFEKTPPLPSYLVAFATGPFESIPIPGLSVPGRVVTTKGQTHLAGLAAEVTPGVLRALETWFGTPYPYKKLDLVAVPEYWAGAMENPGAITYTETALLLDPARASVDQRRTLVRYTAHELAHMWFGDLVTMRWWNDLWLNESFADWMGDKITDQVAPELGVGAEQLLDIQQAMDGDALPSSEPIHRPVTAPEDAMRTVGVTYDKGKSVLGMFEQWMGQETFQKGIRQYLASHAWGNAEAADLWAALSRAAGRDVEPAMASFLDQAGIPLVDVELLGNGQVRLSQQRLLAGGANGRPQRWSVPVTLVWPEGSALRHTSVLLEQPSQIVSLGGKGQPEWVLPNADAQGYYRWSLPKAQLTALAARGRLNTREKIGFIGNAGALLAAGRLSGDAWLRMVGRFGGDVDPQVVGAVIDTLGGARTAFLTPEVEPAFATFVREVLGPALTRWGMEPRAGEDGRVTALRPQVLGWMGGEGKDPKVLAFAAERARKALADPASIDPDLARVVFALAAREGDATLFDAYVKRLETTTVPAERAALIPALGRFEVPALRERALTYALSGSLRANEVFTAPLQMAGTSAGRDRLYQWVTENYDRIKTVLPPPYMSYMPFSAGGCEPERVEKAKVFFSQPAHQVDGTAEELQHVTDSVQGCARLRQREGAAVTGFLLSKRGTGPT